MKKVQKQQEMFGQQFGAGSVNYQNAQQQQAAEGETIIHTKQQQVAKEKELTKDLGEYIDYEEA